MLEVKALCKSYRGLPAIDNVALPLQSLQRIGVLSVVKEKTSPVL